MSAPTCNILIALVLHPLLQHGTLPLREEKAVVQQISKLNLQRERVREYESQRSAMSELESEASKLKSLISELDSEFSVVKGERKQAQVGVRVGLGLG